MDSSVFYRKKRPSVNENEAESEDTSDSEFIPDETNGDSSFSNASSDHESDDDVAIRRWKRRWSWRLGIPCRAIWVNSCMHYKVCTPDAYTWNFNIHCGRNTDFEGLSGTESLTVSLTQKLLHTRSTLYCDNYYSFVGLVEYLLERKTYICGTIRRNRKYLSKDVIGAKMKRNQMKCLQNNKGVKVYNWKDKRNVLMISTVPEHGGFLLPSGKRRRSTKARICSCI